MLTRNTQLLLISALLSSAAGYSFASPVLYAWEGNTGESKGGRTYVIDPVAGTVITLRGAGGGVGSGSGASGGASGGSGGAGGGSGAGANSSGSGGSIGTGGRGGGLSPGALFSASSQAHTFAGPLAVGDPQAHDCGPDQRIAAIGSSTANTGVDVCSETPPTDGLPPIGTGSRDTQQGPHGQVLQTAGSATDLALEFTPSEAPLFLSPSQNTAVGSQSTIAAVSEPTSLALLASALAVFGAMVRRRSR